MPRVHADYVPSYRLHRQSGQAIVTLSGRDHLLGLFGSPPSKVRYHELVAQWLAAGRKPFGATAPKPAPSFVPPSATVATLVAAHARHAREYYVDPDGVPTSEAKAFAFCTAPMIDLFAALPVDDFTPACLKAVRSRMVAKRWARTYVNKQVNRLRMIFKWGAAEELVDVRVYQSLATVAPLKRGRSNVKEAEPVRPVPDALVDAIRGHVAPPVWAIIELQRLTGARGGELVKLRAVDLDTRGPVWLYAVRRHKTSHHGHARTIYFGPRAQVVLMPFMQSRPVDAYLFNPREGNAARKLAGATKGRPRRVGQKPTARTSSRVMGDRYTPETYRRAIERGCERAAVDRWHPHQLRHSAATLWRQRFGPEAALTLLGDKSTRMLDVYAERDAGVAMKIAAEIG